jgi:hypothetical protein
VEQVGIKSDIRVLSLSGYLRIEDPGSKSKIGVAADAAILDPRSSILILPSSIINPRPRLFSTTQSEAIVIFFLHEEFGTEKYGNR